MSKKHKSPRRQGRERAFQVLYGMHFLSEPEMAHLMRTFDHFICDRTQEMAAGNAFALELVRGVLDTMPELDAVIAAHSKNWRLERIAKIELTILRLSLYEMTYRDDVPIKVALNEGIELAKKFGDHKSSRFVNGILDAIVHTKEQEARGRQGQSVPVPPEGSEVESISWQSPQVPTNE